MIKRLLIIDDEPIIVNGLKAFFTKREMPDVEVVLAHSAAEALDWLDTTRIDVVLSDINMPGMTGLDLLTHIERSWPNCKVIFLTGYSEFDYAHQALRSPCVVDYILKTEEMETIGQAVDKAFQIVKDELSVYQQKEWLHRQLPKVITQLQHQLMINILGRTEQTMFRDLQTEFDALQLPFQANLPVMCLLLSVEDWGKYETASEKELMLFAIGNISEELLGARAVVKFTQYDRNAAVGFIQSASQPFVSEEKQHDTTAKFTQGTIESIQHVCLDLFGIHVSAAVSERMHPFHQLFQEVRRLRLASLNGRIVGANRLTVVKQQEDSSVEQVDYSKRINAIYILEQIQQGMVDGREREWGTQFGQFMNLYPDEGPDDPFDRLMLLQCLARLSLLLLEEFGLKDQAVRTADLTLMMQFTVQTPWSEVTGYYQSLLEWIHKMRNDQLGTEELHLIGRIHYYVRMNLASDLSLSRIAREVSMNPSYLSRWYKQKTGKGLSDFIQEVRMEKAKEMLQNTDLKVHEISEELGFTDPHYFFRFFKKNMNCTPQEYRLKK